MKRLCCCIAVLGLVVATGNIAQAQPDKHSVGLGVSVGAAFPEGQTIDKIDVKSWDGSFNWGFYVNIPLISTFHLTPSAELYRFEYQNATDFDLAFKFIVPLPRFDLYAGLVPGLTAVGAVTAPHVGILGGGAFRLVANLDMFVQAKYMWLFEGGGNLRVLHVNTGILFVF